MTTEIILNIEEYTLSYSAWCNYEDNLIVVESDTIEKLEDEAKKVLLDFHNITDIKFKHNFI